MAQRISLSIEGAPKKSFATAVDWPGWSRAGRNEELAISAIAAYALRYAVVPELAGEPFEDPEHVDLEVVERIPGSGSTEFGVPGGVTEHDKRPVSAEDGDRLARLVVASWQVFDETVQFAPDELRNEGPGLTRCADSFVQGQLIKRGPLGTSRPPSTRSPRPST